MDKKKKDLVSAIGIKKGLVIKKAIFYEKDLVGAIWKMCSLTDLILK